MREIYKAGKQNDDAAIVAINDEETSDESREQSNHLALTNRRMMDAAERNRLNPSAFAVAALKDAERFKREENSAHHQALVRARRGVTLDPERMAASLVMLQDLPLPEVEQQYRRLAMSLITAATYRSLRRVLFVSAQHGEGRTSVMLNVAGALARAKMRVLVVDTDFLRPSVMRLLGIESETGIAEVINENRPPGEGAVLLHPFNITALVARAALDNPAEILAAPEFREILDLFEQDFDFILFDSPPLLDSADANLLMRFVDTALMVVRPDTTTAAKMAQAVSLMSREDISGVVMNRVTHKGFHKK